MNVKLMSVLLVVLCFAKNETAVEDKSMTYSELTTLLITAETFDDAKIILGRYDTAILSTVYNHLQLRKDIWIAEHGVFDKVSLKHRINKIAKYFNSTMGVMCLGCSALVLFLSLRNGIDLYKASNFYITPFVLGIIFALDGLARSYEDPAIEKYLNEFNRIKELMYCTL